MLVWLHLRLCARLQKLQYVSLIVELRILYSLGGWALVVVVYVHRGRCKVVNVHVKNWRHKCVSRLVENNGVRMCSCLLLDSVDQLHVLTLFGWLLRVQMVYLLERIEGIRQHKRVLSIGDKPRFWFLNSWECKPLRKSLLLVAVYTSFLDSQTLDCLR